MQVTFYNYTGANNVINKDLRSGTIINCNMQVATEQLQPHVRVTFNDTDTFNAFTYNYCILKFGTKSYAYFIDVNSIKNIGKGVWDVSMKLDLLELYKTDILASEAIIERSSTAYNMYLRDNIYQAYGYPLVGCASFPNGFSDTYTYLLNVCNTLGGV